MIANIFIIFLFMLRLGSTIDGHGWFIN